MDTPEIKTPETPPANQLGIPAVMQDFAQQTQEAAIAGGVAQGARPVMEIDPAASAEVQAAERLEAQRLGIPVVMKGGGKAPAPDAGAAGGGKAGGHPLFGGGGQEQRFAMPEPTPEVLQYFEAAGIKDPAGYIRDLPTMQTRLAEMSSKYDEMEQQVGAYSGLSEDVQEIIDAELSGRNWREEVMSGLDYSKPFSKNNLRSVVERLSKVRLSEEDWTEYKDSDGDPRAKQRVESAIEEARERFEEKRSERMGAAGQRAQRQQEVNRRVNDSRNKAVDFLDRIPGSAAHKDRVAKHLTPKDILGFFFEKDMVTYKPDAGLNAWILLDRDSLIGGVVGDAEGRANNAAMTRMLGRMDERSPNRPRAGGGGGSGMTAEQIALERYRAVKGF